MWKTCLRDIEATDQAVVFGLGDYLDPHRTTLRVALKQVWNEDDKALQQYDDMLLDTFVHPFVDGVRRYCPSFAQKCVGLVEGNHHGVLGSTRFKNGRTTTEEICKLLGVRYLGLSAWVRLTVYRSRGHAKLGNGRNLNVLLNHSVSTSGKLAYSLAAAQRKIEGWRDVDIFLSANDHQLGHVLRQEIGCAARGMPRPMEFQQVIGKVGSFQKGYQVGAVSNHYVEKKLLSPSQLGYLAFDAHVYHRELPQEERKALGITTSPEVWRYDNFSV